VGAGRTNPRPWRTSERRCAAGQGPILFTSIVVHVSIRTVEKGIARRGAQALQQPPTLRASPQVRCATAQGARNARPCDGDRHFIDTTMRIIIGVFWSLMNTPQIKDDASAQSTVRIASDAAERQKQRHRGKKVLFQRAKHFASLLTRITIRAARWLMSKTAHVAVTGPRHINNTLME
jgi:hypothetical protein